MFEVRSWRAVPVVVLAVVALLLVLWLAFARPWANPPVAASPASTDQPADEDQPPQGPVDFTWVAVVPEFGPVGPLDSYRLEVGTAADQEPTLEREVQMVRGIAPETGGRFPAVSSPVGGVLVFVSDDGNVSRFHRVGVRGDPREEVVAEIDHAVWSIQLAPDGRHAYAIVNRRGQLDGALVRVALDGSGAVDEVMPAIAREPTPRIQLVAVAPFTTTLRIAPDGNLVARRICRFVNEFACTLDVLDTASGELRRLPDRGDVGGLVGVGDGMVFFTQCMALDCGIWAMDIASGEELRIGGQGGMHTTTGTVTSVDERLVLVTAVAVDAGPPTVVEAIDVASGERSVIFRAAPESMLSVYDLDARALWSAPPGWVIVNVATQARSVDLAIPVAGGEPVELPQLRIEGLPRG